MIQNKQPERPFRLAIPRSRRLTMDVLHLHRQVPTCAHDRKCDLRRLVNARKSGRMRISWSILFIKAFAIVAARHPVLRQTYMAWPWAHLYQHPESVAVIAMHRELNGESWLFWSRFACPEATSLVELQRQLERYQEKPVEKVFRNQWLLSGMPTFLRRLLWWWTLNVSGAARAKRSGTFSLTTIAAGGAEIQHPPGFLTSNLTFGPLDEHSCARITIAYDHRLMDGLPVARFLAELEETLCGVIADELAALDTTNRSPAAHVKPRRDEGKSGQRAA